MACGGDDGGAAGGADASALACGETGSGTVEGAITGESVAPIASAWTTSGGGRNMLVISEDGATCGDEPAGGQHLVFLICAPLAAGDIEVVAEADFPDGDCSADPAAFAFVESEGGADLVESVSGTLTIDGLETCLDGSFSVSFDGGDTLTGSFSALRCQ